MFATLFRRPKAVRIRSCLAALALSCLVPMCFASVYLAHCTHKNRVALLEQNLLVAANILSAALDRELAVGQASLEALATSPALRSGDITAFQSQALSVIENYPDSDIILADAAVQQTINAYKPSGSALPRKLPRERVSSVFEKGRSSICNVFKCAVTGRYLIGVDVPVFQNARVRYDLAMTLPADRISTLFRLPELPPEWLITVLDGNNTIVARSNSPEQHTGKQISAGLSQVIAGLKQGTTEGDDMEGNLSTVGFRRSDKTGWTVLVSLPNSLMAREHGLRLVWMIVSLGALVGFGLGTALIISRIISRSVQDLIEPALALGRGETVGPGHFELVETGEVATALSDASDLLRRRDEARDRAYEVWQEAEKRVERDGLTGVYNRLRFNEILSVEIARSSRYKLPFALVIFDIDALKAINDTHGREAGDETLKTVTNIVDKSTRESDLIARWGGDDFFILLPQQNTSTSALVAERTRAAIETHSFDAVGHITCSFGVAEFRLGDTLETLTARAHHALHKAKKNGKNRVEKAENVDAATLDALVKLGTV